MREGKKKGLLIGVQYGLSEATVLDAPHRDVRSMERVLIDLYRYRPEDLVLLIDDNIQDHIQPTERNIIDACNNLVEGAQAGDKLFLLFSGHGTQVRNGSGTEEDGMDECILTSDKKPLRDNLLRSMLVDPLPFGCTLTAVFDCCHSATCLDLDHFRCNRTYGPWISKGRRRTNTLWNTNVRRGAVLVEVPTRRSFEVTNLSDEELRIKKSFTRRPPTRARTMPNTAQQHRPPSRKATLPSVLPGKRIYINECPDKETRIKEIFDRRPPSRARTLTIAPSGKRAPINEPHNMADSISKTINRGPSLSIRTQTLQQGVFELDIPQCTSPEKRWACTGDCEPMEKRVADVISLASCKDDQVAWENPEGGSLTQALIKVLGHDKHPTLRYLMTSLGHELHRYYLGLHDNSKAFKEAHREYRKRRIAKEKSVNPPPIVEMDNFQDPQLSSHVPLNMNRQWDP